MIILLISLTITLSLALSLAFIVRHIAIQKGKDPAAWYLYGVVLFPIAFLHILLIDKDNPNSHNSTMLSSRDIISANNNNMPIQIASPLRLDDYEIYKNGETKLAFNNYTAKDIKAIKINLKAKNIFGESIIFNGKDVLKLILENPDISPNPPFESDHFIYNVKFPNSLSSKNIFILHLENDQIRNLEIIVTEIIYTDNSITKIEDYSTIEQPQLTEIIYSDPLNINRINKINKILHEKGVKSSTYLPIFSDKFWVCSCGCINPKTAKNCLNCSASKEIIKKNVKPEVIENIEFQVIEEYNRIQEKRKKLLKKVLKKILTKIKVLKKY
ncbi:MAG: hypothetical protein LBT99_01785 [Bifidobacteriaceae bacterium]|jgi:hypothetical protein|nr:hypothetical protein [Bifidobacteriaceae bacterium]